MPENPLASTFARSAIVACTSLDVGSVRLTERFIRADPPTDEDCRRVQREVRARYAAATRKLEFAPQVMIGSGGTFMALAHISLRLRGWLFPGQRGRTYADTGRWLAGSSVEELLAG